MDERSEEHKLKSEFTPAALLRKAKQRGSNSSATMYGGLVRGDGDEKDRDHWR